MADRTILSMLGATMLVGGAWFTRTAVPLPSTSQPTTEEPGAKIVVESEGPWLAAQKYFGAGLSDACKQPKRWDCVSKDSNPQFLILTIPDPKRTHLALDFDRSIESLTAAVSTEDFEMEQFWLPWSLERDPALLLLADRKRKKDDAERIEKEPGLLIFRNSKDTRTLLVFLVGEAPTSGVSQDALANAIQYEQEISCYAEKPLQSYAIAGPSFSGSLHPLAKALKILVSSTPVRIVSGMTTDREAEDAMVNTLKSMGNGSTYVSVLEDDTEAGLKFARYSASHHWRDRIAILSESGTTYGAEVMSQNGWENLRYPREIARLRNAFQDEVATQSTGKEPVAASPEFKLNLKDGQSESHANDSIPAFSPLQSPASQQAVLIALADTLRHDRIEMVGIAATDVLDAIFLSRYLRSAVPDARLFMFDSDLLFSREVQNAPLTGMLAVTTYPLIVPEPAPSGPPALVARHDRFRFPSRYAEGVFVACREGILGPARPPKNQNLWLTVLGRNGYWPVAILNAAAAEHPETAFRPEGPAAAWFIFFWVLVIIALLHSLSMVAMWIEGNGRLISWVRSDLGGRLAPSYRLWRRSSRLGGWLAARLPRVTGRSLAVTSHQWLGRIFCAYPAHDMGPTEKPYLLASTLLIALTFYILDSTAWRLVQSGMTELRFYSTFGIVVIVMLLLLTPRLTLIENRGEDYYLITFQVWGFSVFFGVVWYLLVHDRNNAAGYFFAYRSLAFTTGVSPAVPFLLLILAFLCWSWTHLKREGQIRGHGNPEQYGFQEARRYFLGIDESVGEIFAPQVWLPALVLVLLWFLLMMPWRTIRSLESRWYDLVFLGSVALLYWGMAATWTQFIWCWQRLKGLLQWLENQPFREAFSRLDQPIKWVPLIGKPGDHFLFVTSRCQAELEALQEYQGSLVRPSDGLFLRLPGIADEASGKLKSIYHEAASGSDKYVQLYGELIARHAEATEIIENDYNNHHVRRRPEGVVSIEENFLALRYLIYIRYIFRHLRNLVGCTVTAFILSILSLNSYPFLAHRWIGISSTVVFAALGIGVGMVFAQMDKDALLSRVTKTNAGELGSTFYFRMLRFGSLAVLTLIASQFPSVNQYIFSWLQPALDSLR